MLKTLFQKVSLDVQINNMEWTPDVHHLRLYRDLRAHVSAQQLKGRIAHLRPYEAPGAAAATVMKAPKLWWRSVSPHVTVQKVFTEQ